MIEKERKKEKETLGTLEVRIRPLEGKSQLMRPYLPDTGHEGALRDETPRLKAKKGSPGIVTST